MQYLKKVTLALVLISLGAIFLGAKDRSGEKEYGDRTETSISVYVAGNLQNPGIYHLEKGTRLRDLIEMCGGYGTEGDFGGSYPPRFTIRRMIEGKLHQMVILRKDLEEKDQSNFELQNGDILFADAVIL